LDFDTFFAAIHARHKLRVRFFSKEDGYVLTRTCAPMDYSPMRRAHDGRKRLHFWDYTSDTGAHTLSLLPEQVRSIETLPVTFDPGEFVTWTPRWTTPRDWGRYS
jgi:hypothetical protein